MTSMTHTGPGVSWHAPTDDRVAASHQRLDEAYWAAAKAPWDDRAPLVIFSDHHRGDGSRLDPFAANRGLFLRALRHYYDQGFTYVEAGDGDDLWKGWRFADIERAHGELFDLLHCFQRQQRLHLLFGNHEELAGGGYQQDKGGLPAREALVLEHARTGQRLFIVHGHQADPQNNADTGWSRRFVRYLWTPMQSVGLASLDGPVRPITYAAADPISRSIERWAAVQRHLVICGHTHRPVFARPGAAPYFNTGACLHPGQITGLEIVGGLIQMVRWTSRALHPNAPVRREVITPALPLSNFC